MSILNIYADVYALYTLYADIYTMYMLARPSVGIEISLDSQKPVYINP